MKYIIIKMSGVYGKNMKIRRGVERPINETMKI